MTFRAAATGNDGTTSAARTSFTMTIPASGPGGTVVAGDVAIAVMSQNTGAATFTAPAGWSVLSGPDDNNGNLRTVVWTKTLAAGDINTPLTWSSSGSGRLLGAISVHYGVTVSGALATLATDTGADATWVSPPITTTGNNWSIVNLWAARNGAGAAATGTMPASQTNDATAQTNTSAPNYTIQVSHLNSPGAAGSYGNQTASVSAATTDNIYTIALAPTAATATVVGATATATGSADSGVVSSGWTVTGATGSASAASYPGIVSTTPAVVIAGVAAQATASSAPGVANPLPIVIQPAPSPEYPPAPFRDAWRNGGLTYTYLVSATLGGSPVAGAQNLTPIGGSITDTSKAGVRRVLNLELAPATGLYDLLAPIGTTLSVTCRITYQNRSTFDLPMGVFDVDSEKITEGGGSITLTAPDKWARIQRARFIGIASSTRGLSVTDQIAVLVRGALGAGETVVVNTSNTTTKVPALTWDKDRDQAIISLADSIGAWCYFDRNGTFTIDDVRTVSLNADWLIDASPQGVLISLDREKSRTQTRNVVVVTSTYSGGERFPVQYVWDNDPNSPTYAGLDPKNQPGTAGPFGIVPYYFDTPIAITAAEGRAAGQTVLAKTTGLASQVTLTQVTNPAVDAMDVIDVLPPGNTPARRVGSAAYPSSTLYPDGNTYPGSTILVPGSGGRVLERHVVDTVTHPLAIDQAQNIDGRSTRTDAYAGG